MKGSLVLLFVLALLITVAGTIHSMAGGNGMGVLLSVALSFLFGGLAIRPDLLLEPDSVSRDHPARRACQLGLGMLALYAFFSLF